MRRLAEADEEFCDKLEEIGLDRIREQDAKANPLLYLAFFNANLPHKYRPNAMVVDDDSAKETLAEFKKLNRRPHRGEGANGATN